MVITSNSPPTKKLKGTPPKNATKKGKAKPNIGNVYHKAIQLTPGSKKLPGHVTVKMGSPTDQPNFSRFMERGEPYPILKLPEKVDPDLLSKVVNGQDITAGITVKVKVKDLMSLKGQLERSKTETVQIVKDLLLICSAKPKPRKPSTQIPLAPNTQQFFNRGVLPPKPGGPLSPTVILNQPVVVPTVDMETEEKEKNVKPVKDQKPVPQQKKKKKKKKKRKTDDDDDYDPSIDGVEEEDQLTHHIRIGSTGGASPPPLFVRITPSTPITPTPTTTTSPTVVSPTNTNSKGFGKSDNNRKSKRRRRSVNYTEGSPGSPGSLKRKTKDFTRQKYHRKKKKEKPVVEEEEEEEEPEVDEYIEGGPVATPASTNTFWRYVDSLFEPVDGVEKLKPLELTAIDSQKNRTFQLPELGDHYSKTWAREDVENDDIDVTCLPKDNLTMQAQMRRLQGKHPNRLVRSTRWNVDVKSNSEVFEDGSLVQRLLSSLVSHSEEPLTVTSGGKGGPKAKSRKRGSSYDENGDMWLGVKMDRYDQGNFQSTVSANPHEYTAGNLSTIDERIKSELLRMNITQKPGDKNRPLGTNMGDDEISIRMRQLQETLKKKIMDGNRTKTKLRQDVITRMPQEATRKKKEENYERVRREYERRFSRRERRKG